MSPQEAYNKMVAYFCVHLYTTHGIPTSISLGKLIKKTPLQIHLMMLKHKDFCRGKI